MATRKIISKHIAHSSSSYVGRDGELVLDTATNTLKITDGSTPGGVTLNTDGSSSVDYSSIEVLTGAGSSNSGSPTVLNADKTVSIINHNDGTIRYYSVANGTSNGQIKIIRYSSIAKPASGGNSVRSLIGNFDYNGNYGLGINTSITLLWYETKWYIIAETEN